MEGTFPHQSPLPPAPRSSTLSTFKGLLIDTVSHIGERIPFPSTTSPIQSQTPESNTFTSTFPMNWIVIGTVDFEDPNVGIHPRYRPILQYPLGEHSQMEAFMRMIIMDKAGDGDENPPRQDLNRLYFSPWVKEIVRAGCAKQKEERLRAGIVDDELGEEEGNDDEEDRFLEDGTEITLEMEEEWARERALLDVGSEERAVLFDKWVMRTCAGKMMLRGKKGFLGITEGNVEVGDFVCLLKEIKEPVVLRQVVSRDTGEMWMRVGDAYVHRIMDDEAWGLGLEEREVLVA
ncbi:hypothetical protein DL98DRAFT_625714 [Cadophora sp. DSE1049]|nr:hypothetical protein DL98DRAFT_625714 [Cadophora sp. DSE1049]